MKNILITSPNPTSIEKLAKKVCNLANQGFQNLLTNWTENMTLVWKNNSPQTIFDAMQKLKPGSPAAFISSSESAAIFLESEYPGCTKTLITLVKKTVSNSDGSVTVTP